MARQIGRVEYVETTATASIQPPLPSHVAGNFLLVFAVGDNVITAFTATGWTIGGQLQSGGTTTSACRAGWFYKIAASSAETITITSASTTWCATALCYEGVHATTPIDVSNGNGIAIAANPGTATAFAAASVTTTTANALVLWTMFNSLSTPSPFPGVRTVSAHDTGAIGLGIGMIPQAVAGATGTLDFYTEDHVATTQNSVSFTIALRDSATPTVLPAYLDKAHATMLTPFRGITASVRGETVNATNTNVFTNLSHIARGQSKAVFHYKTVGAVFTDITAAANNVTTGDFTLLNAGFGVNDYIAFCSDAPFGGLSGVSTVAGAGGTFAWQVFDGTTWNPITVTFGSWVTTTWTTFTWPAATVGVKWSMVIDPAILRKISSIWKPATLNGVTGYWIRNVFTAVPTTNATFSYIVPSEGGVSYDALAAAADTGGNPFHNSASSTPSVYAATLPGLSGTYRTLGTGIAPFTPTGKTIVGTWTFGTARDYIDAGARQELSGVCLSLIDATWNDRTYYIGGYGAKDTYQNERNVYALQWDAVTKTYNNGNPQVNPTTFSHVGIFARQIRGAGIQYYNQCVAYGIPKLSGGTSANPITNREFLDTFAIDYYYPIPLIRKNECIIPIQIGGGDAVKVVLDSLPLTFPKLTTEPNAFATEQYCSYHYDSAYLGLIFDGRAGDIIKITNSPLQSESRWRFEFLATATNTCTWDFKGTSVINAKVTLKPVTTFDLMTFRQCEISSIVGCTVTNSTFSTSTLITAGTGTTLTGNTFDATTGAAALDIAANTEMALVTKATFSNNATYGLRLTSSTAQTYTFDNIQFSNNTKDLYVAATTGTVIINLINGSSIPTYISAGATVQINNTRTLTLTGLIAGSRVAVISTNGTADNYEDDTEVAGTTNSGTTFTYDYNWTGVATVVNIKVIHTTKGLVEFPNISLGANGVSLPIQPATDRQYENPA